MTDDGNCLFHALAKEITGSQKHHFEVRLAIVNFMQCDPTFAKYVEKDFDKQSKLTNLSLKRLYVKYWMHFSVVCRYLDAIDSSVLETLCKFAVQETEHPPLDSSIAKVLLDNLKLLNETAFAQDLQLTHEIVNSPNISGKPTGVILIPEQSNCIACGTTLLLHSDWPSHLALYTEALGTITAFHYHKYCPNRKGDCKLVQFYGFTSSGRHKGFRNDEKWNTL